MRGSISVYQTRHGKRWAIVYDGPPKADGKRRQVFKRGFKTRRDAEGELRRKLVAVEDQVHVDASKITLGDYLRRWLKGLQCKATTADRYRQSAVKHVIPRIGHVRLQSLTADDLDACYRQLEEGGRRDGGPLSAKSVRHAHTMLSKALGDAVRRGHVVRNVASDARPPRLERREMKVWAAGQLRAFLAHVNGDRLYAMWLLLATTGMRRGEVLGLQWDSVDLDVGRLAIVRAITKADGKAVVSEPKTVRGRRVIALDPATVAALRAHRARQLAERLVAGGAWQDSQLVFCWPDGTALDPQLPTKWFKRHTRDAGLPAIRLHDLRHTWATVALVRGVPAKVVSERLGHASVAITLDVYSHVLPALDEQAAATVADAILGDTR